MKTYDNLQDTLSFYNIECNELYYISSGNPVFNFPDKPFRMDYYAFCICISGEIHIKIDNSDYTIGADGFLISAPSTIVHFLGTSEDFVMKLLFFEKHFLLKNISNPFLIEKLNLFQNNAYSIVQTTQPSAHQLVNLLDYLKEKSQRKRKFTEEIVRTIIFNLLLEIAEIIDEGEVKQSAIKETKKDLFLKFLRLVQENVLEFRTVQYYADRLYVSNKNLIQSVKKASGKTPHQIIDEAILKEAFVLLGNPQITISEIAYQLHFNSTSAFGRFFKKCASISPSQYREKEKI